MTAMMVRRTERTHLRLRVEELEPRITLAADVTPPFVVSTVPVQGTEVTSMPQYDVTFSEPLDRMYVNFREFSVDGIGAGTLAVVKLGAQFLNDETVRFTMKGQPGNGPFSINLGQGVVRDLAHNLSAPDSRNFVGSGGAPLGAPDGSEFSLPYKFQDDDGTWVTVSLKGPGQGTVSLVGGAVTWATIDTITLEGTTKNSKLEIKTKGGALPGTSFKNLYVNGAAVPAGFAGNSGAILNAANAEFALGKISAPKVDVADDGRIEVNGGVKKIELRDIGQNVTVDIEGSVKSVKIRGTEQDFIFGAAGDIGKFNATRIGWGALISAGDAIGSLKASIGVMYNTVISAGEGGIGELTVQSMSTSVVKSIGSIGKVKVLGNLEATSIAADIGPGADGKYGTNDDVLISAGVVGAIQSVNVLGNFTGSGDPNDHYGVVSHGTIGSVKVGGIVQQLPWLFGNVTVAQNWK